MGLRLCLWREETRIKGADTNGGTEEVFSVVRVWSKVGVLRAIEDGEKIGDFNLIDKRLT
jgi:hypothetical protein